MPFGLKNAAQAFQYLMGTVFQNVGCVFVYLYDILVASLSYKEHLEDLQTVCQRPKTFGLTIRLESVFSVSDPYSFLVTRSQQTALFHFPLN